MIHVLTAQDFEKANTSETERVQFIKRAIEEHKASEFYRKALEAESYFRGENTKILSRTTKLRTRGGLDIDLSETKIPTNFFKRFVIQQAGTLLNYGIQVKKSTVKDKLGTNFDTVLSVGGENALKHGITYFFLNYNKVENFTALECFLLLDEYTSEPKIGVRFTQINDSTIDRPLLIELYEIDGASKYAIKGNEISVLEAKKSYRQTVRPITNDVVEAVNYNALPIVYMQANEYGDSELTVSLKSKIDLYDFIFSDFGDTMARIKGILWVFQNFSGTGKELREIANEIEELGIVAAKDPETTAAPHTIEVPHQAVSVALELLEKAMYKDYMAMNMDEITGGSLTNVAIKTAMENMLKKVGRWERQQVIETCRQLLMLVGVDTANIKFRYDIVINELENAQILSMTRDDLDLKTALEKNPIVDPDEVADILGRKALENAEIDKKRFPLEEEVIDDAEPGTG